MAEQPGTVCPGQRNPYAVWTTELRELLREQVETVSSGHPATGSEQEGKLCRTWEEELELPLAEQNELAWSMALLSASYRWCRALQAGLLEPRRTFPCQ